MSSSDPIEDPPLAGKGSAGALRELRRHPEIWRPGDHGHLHAPGEPTGFAALDRALPGGGWPRSGLIELLIARPGIGEMRLLLPLVRRAIDAGRRVLLVHPPHLPYAPAWHEHDVDLSRLSWLAGSDDEQGGTLAERAARSGACGGVLVWLHATRARTGSALRRLQLAAQAGRCIVVVLRPLEAASEPSPAALRASLEVVRGALHLTVRKCRGRAPGTIRLLASSPP